MAEIKIRKKKSMTWLWILLIIVILLSIILWAIGSNKISLSQHTEFINLFKSEQAFTVRQKSITQVPGVVSIKLETYIT